MSPKNIIGFDADRTSYEVGVGSTVSQATIAATANQSGATVAITPADADAITDGHQVSLSAGRNAVTITVTAEDTTTTKTYTVSVNQGVNTPLGWKAESDVDSLKHHEANRPRGIWADSDNIWVIDSQDKKIYGFNRTTQALARTINLDTSLLNYSCIWSDGTHIWACEGRSTSASLVAYQLSDGTRATTKDITTLTAAQNYSPFSIWSDRMTMWVADRNFSKAFAYHLVDDCNTPENEFGTRHESKDIELTDLWTADDHDPAGVWANNSTLWIAAAPVSEPSTLKVQAYRQSDKAHQPELDIDIAASGNTNPAGIYYDGSTFFVTDTTDDKVYAYNMPPASTDATLSALTVSPKNIIGFDADRTYYEVGVASTVAQVTIAATANDSGATVAITPADADDMTDGHQVSLSAGRNAVTITVTAEDSSTETYTVSVNQGVDTDYGWKADDDFDGLIAAENDAPYGIWSNGTTMWVSDIGDDKIYAYDLTTRLRDTAKEFNTLTAADNATPYGIWSDGTTMWVADWNDQKIYAYRMSDKQRDSSKDFNTLKAAGNTRPTALWSDGTTMWIADRGGDAKLYAYRMSDKQHDSSKDFNNLKAANNYNPTGIWSDHETMWVGGAISEKVFAYRMSDTARVASKEYDTLEAAGNSQNFNIWSDGDTMWVADFVDDKIYSYNHPPSNDATLSSIITEPENIIGFAPTRTSYELGLASTVATATVAAQTTNAYASVTITPADADTNTDGHQISLSAGKNTVTFAVTAQDSSTTQDYTVNINRGVADDYGWKADDDLDGFGASDLFGQTGIASNGATFWITTENDLGIYAFNRFGYREATRDIAPTSDNGAPAHLWANPTTLYVVDGTDLKVYVYQTSDGARQTSSKFSFHADNANPAGIWSDGITVWILDDTDDKLYAYTKSGGARDDDKDITLDSDNGMPTGFASNGRTVWVADSEDDKLYAYMLSDGSRVATKEINALTGAGNADPTGMWATEDTVWVNDAMDSKAYSYNIPIEIPLQALSDDADFSALTISPKDIIGFEADRITYEVGVASGVATATVTATTSDENATVMITPADSDTTADGHQVNLSAGRNSVTVTVTASNTVATKTYTVSINQGVDTVFGWKAVDDLDGLIAAENESPRGVWSDGTTMWVSDHGDDKIYAYRMSDGQHDSSKDFNTLDAANNNLPQGIWSDGATMWVTDSVDNKIYAYRMSDRQRDSSKDFNTLATNGNHDPYSIWSDGATMWVTDRIDRKIYAYRMSDKQPYPNRTFNNLHSDNRNPTGIWSDYDTMWVADFFSSKIFAYRMSDMVRASSKEFNTLDAVGNNHIHDIWSDGTTMWVLDSADDKVYSYNHPASDVAALSALTVSPRDIIIFDPDDTHYDVGVASTVAQATITATKAHIYASVAITPADVSPGAPGHQVDLSAGLNLVDVTVTAQDGATMTYEVNINRGVTDPYGWKAEHDLDALILTSETDRPVGVAEHAGIIWVTTTQSNQIRAYNLDGTHATTRDITPHTSNGAPTKLWTDGATMWVVDRTSAATIYAYRLSDGARQTALEISLHTDNGLPAGIWSDNQTIWVLDAQDDSIYAYALDGGNRREDREFSRDAENTTPTGIWADGHTIWVSDTVPPATLFAYHLNTGTRDALRDFNTLFNAANWGPTGLWSDGTTMWVVDSARRKVYSYIMPLASPANLQAEAGDTRATLTWDDPQNSDITGYQYRVSADDGNTWNPDWYAVPGSSRTTTSLTLRDLTNGVEHRFEVRALKSALQSEPAITRATPMEPPTVPLAPALKFFDSLNEQIRARWTHPVHDPRVPTTSYDVRYRRYGTSDRWQNVSRTDTDLSTQQVIGGLTNRQGYVIEVAAVNEIGRGPWASGMTAPQGPQSPPSDPTDVAPGTFSLGPLGALWTNGYPATGPHPDRDPLNVNSISTPCAGDTGFTVLWEVHDEVPLEYEAHFITRYGAGEFRHSFVTDDDIPTADDNISETKILTGSVEIHGYSFLTVRVRARFDDAGWGPWSGPVSLFCTNQERTEETSQLQVAEGQQAEPTNTPATGKPDINGRTEEGDTLTVSTSRIYDANGMNDASFTYQWSRYNGTTTTPIPGATGSTYTLQEADLDHQVSVTVSFTDDDGFAESVTSEEVCVQPPSPLYGGFVAGTVPDEHDGDNAFKFEIRFSEEPSLGFAAVRDHVLDITNGEVTAVKRATTGSNQHWKITLEPDGDEDVTVTLPPTTDCSAQGAVCTEKGKMLSNAASRTIAGPGTVSEQVQVENSPATGQPTITGTAAIGNTLGVSLMSVSDDNGLTGASHTYQWLRGSSAISGATSSTYTVVKADGGHNIKVTVSFTDDDGFDESVTSNTVYIERPPLTAELVRTNGTPANHDGSSTFTIQLNFSEDFGISYVTVRDRALDVTGGTVLNAARVNRTGNERNQRWTITIDPSGNADIEIALTPTTDCNDDDAICTPDGRMLSSQDSITVAGP